MSTLWSQRNGREKFLLVLMAAAVIIGVPLFLFPGDSSTGKLLPAAQARQKYKEVEKQKTSLDAETDKLKPEIEKLVYKDAPEHLLPTVVKKLQTDAKAAGIHLREIKPIRARRLAGITKVPLTVRFTSRFEQSVPFLYNVEDPKGKLVVEKFNITMSDPKSKMVDVEVQVALFTEALPTAGTVDTGA